MKRELRTRSKEEKESILLDIQATGVTLGCRKHGINKSCYYDWLSKYEAGGLQGLEDRRGKDLGSQLRRVEKENRVLKEMIVDRDLKLKMQEELLKKKIAQWNSAGTSSASL